MAEVKWIKITTSMFDDEKIKLIEKMPEGTSILIIWIKLLVLAGKCNATGYIYLNENIPYTDEMLSTIFGMETNIVRLALTVFENFKMIKIFENQVIKIVNWEKHQNVEGMDKIREDTKRRVQNYRARQKQLKSGNSTEVTDCNVTCNDTVTQCNDIEEEEERDKDIYIDNISLSINHKYIDAAKTKIDGLIDGLNNDNNSKVKEIINRCNLYSRYDKDLAEAISIAIQMLYFNSEYAKNNLKLPLETVRIQLDKLSIEIIQYAIKKMQRAVAFGTKISNPTAYLQSCIFNAITESSTSLLSDEYLAQVAIDQG